MQPLGPISSLDQETLVELANNRTKPKTGSGYRDPADVKALFGMARFSKDKHDWKVAFQARQKARSEWERTQLAEAVQGNWGAFRKIRKKNDNKWEMAYADAQDDPHQSIHAHFQQLYSSEERVEPCVPELPFEPISMDELKSAVHGGKSGVSVGQDGTSQELLVGVMNAEGGAAALLTWFNNLLYSGDLPDDWYRALMVVLPKTASPSSPKELRPISMSSAISKTFCRVLLQRAKKTVKSIGAYVTTSFVLTASCNSRESGGLAFAFSKLTLRKRSTMSVGLLYLHTWNRGSDAAMNLGYGRASCLGPARFWKHAGDHQSWRFRRELDRDR